MIEIIVRGTPGPQGSKSFKGMSKKGHALLVESSAKVAPWREAVKWAALGKGRITGPVSLEVMFTLVRPKSAKKNAVPDKKPDLSKLIRSTEDALTDAGIWEDDSRVIRTMADKVYVGAQDSLDVPGAVIRIRRAA